MGIHGGELWARPLSFRVYLPLVLQGTMHRAPAIASHAVGVDACCGQQDHVRPGVYPF